MKSSIRIAVSAIGLVSTVLISAAAAPAARRIEPVSETVKTEAVSADKNAPVTEPVENDYRMMTIEDPSLYPASSAAQSNATTSSSAAVAKPSAANASKNSKAPSSQAPSQQVSQPTKEAPSSAAPQQPLSEPVSLGAFLPVSQQATPVPTPVDGATIYATFRDENGGELLWVNGEKLPVKEALKRIVSNEVNASMNYEAIKAQAVAAHSYVKYYNESGGSASLGMQKSYTVGGLVDRAVEEVYDQVATIGGRAIYAPYCSQSCGRTQSSREVWGGTRSYLVAVDSKYDVLAPKYETVKTLSVESVRSSIKSSLGIEPSGDPAQWFRFLSEEDGGYTSGGYVHKIYVAGKKTTGVKVRSMFNLRSACFTVRYTGKSFAFTTHGYGHGVGLSQWGAHYYAVKDGWNYLQIITHYFTGVAISKVV